MGKQNRERKAYPFRVLQCVKVSYRVQDVQGVKYAYGFQDVKGVYGSHRSHDAKDEHDAKNKKRAQLLRAILCAKRVKVVDDVKASSLRQRSASSIG